MKAPRTVIGTIAHSRLFRSRVIGRSILALAVALLLLLGFFPEKHRAAVTLTPTDPTSFGLSGALGQLGALNSVFGDQAAVEVALKVARSLYVQRIVADRIKLRQRLRFENDTAMYRWMARKVNIRSLRGGIILVEMDSGDANLGRDIVGGYAAATQERLAQISRGQTEYKRDVLLKLVGEASGRVSRARAAYDTFRLQNRFGDPVTSISAIASQVPTLEAEIRGKQIQINAARQFYTDDNMQVRQLIAELQGLQTQLTRARATSPTQSDSVGRAVLASTRAEELLRELKIAQMLYDGYMRFLEGTTAENLTSNANIRILEPAFVDTARQVNYAPLAAALALLLLWAAVEFYRLRPPVGDRVIVRETYA
jgi:capsule polysaccharide export protein KpsE/RkpR